MLTKLRVAGLVALCCLSVLALASCGDDEPAAATASTTPEAASSPGGYLLSVHDLQLKAGRAGSVDFELPDGGSIDILCTTRAPLVSYRLFTVSAPPVSEPLGGQDISLGGNGKSNGEATGYLLTADDLSSGWYRFEFTGDGRLLWLAVVRR
jgi:hypothetical protein